VVAVVVVIGVEIIVTARREPFLISTARSSHQEASSKSSTHTPIPLVFLQVVEAGAVTPLLALLETHDTELRILATAAVANALAFCDTTFLANTQLVEDVASAMDILLELVKR